MNQVQQSKNYWKIIHRVMNKCMAPKIPPILKEGTFILNCIDKAKRFQRTLFKSM